MAFCSLCSGSFTGNAGRSSAPCCSSRRAPTAACRLPPSSASDWMPVARAVVVVAREALRGDVGRARGDPRLQAIDIRRDRIVHLHHHAHRPPQHRHMHRPHRRDRRRDTPIRQPPPVRRLPRQQGPVPVGRQPDLVQAALLVGAGAPPSARSTPRSPCPSIIHVNQASFLSTDSHAEPRRSCRCAGTRPHPPACWSPC